MHKAMWTLMIYIRSDPVYSLYNIKHFWGVFAFKKKRKGNSSFTTAPTSVFACAVLYVKLK